MIFEGMYHSHLLQALDIPSVSACVHNRVLSLYNRIFKVESPIRNVCAYLVSQFITTGKSIKHTLVDRVINMGFNLVDIAFNKNTYVHNPPTVCDGHVDSLRYLIYNENYIKPWSEEYVLVKLLTRSF